MEKGEETSKKSNQLDIFLGIIIIIEAIWAAAFFIFDVRPRPLGGYIVEGLIVLFVIIFGMLIVRSARRK